MGRHKEAAVKVEVSIRCPLCDHLFTAVVVEGWQPPAWAEWWADQIELASNGSSPHDCRASIFADDDD